MISVVNTSPSLINSGDWDPRHLDCGRRRRRLFAEVIIKLHFVDERMVPLLSKETKVYLFS